MQVDGDSRILEVRKVNEPEIWGVYLNDKKLMGTNGSEEIIVSNIYQRNLV